MSDPRIPSDLMLRIRRLEDRLATLERKSVNSVGDNAFRGSLAVRNDMGITVIEVGESADGGFRAGSFPTGDQFDTFLEVQQQGLARPYISATWTRSNDPEIVTSGIMGRVYQAQVEAIPYTHLTTTVTATSDVGTTGEFRLRHVASGNVTSTISVPSGSAGTFQTFRWNLLGFAAAGTGPSLFYVEARRTGGAGNLYVWPPTTLSFGYNPLATGTGV